MLNVRMTDSKNPNILPYDSKQWIEEVSDNWDQYRSRFIDEYKRGELEQKDVIEVARKVGEYMDDDGVVDDVKRLMGLT